MLARAAAFALLGAPLAGCQTAGDARVGEIPVGHRPALDTDEAGLWMVADETERAVRESGRVETDPRLNAYLARIVCRLAPQHCSQIRVDVIRTPGFNASMSPNGHMQVWTGLVLRAANEDQLAYVLGHELIHYLERHSVERWRAIRAATDASTFLQLLTAAAGVPVVGQVGGYVALGGLLAYSRDQEREADEAGIVLMARAGYDPAQAPRIWHALLDESEAEDDPAAAVFFSTHPGARERVETLQALAAELSAAARAPSADSTHSALLARFRDDWLAAELSRRRHGATLVLLERLAHDREAAATIAFHRGEVYRLRNAEGDAARAVAAYREAIAGDGAPAEAHRSLGLLLWRSGDAPGAREAFRSYLRASPRASDREMVARYLSELGG